MKIFLLADGNSAHTSEWVLSLLEEGVELFLFSLNEIGVELKEYEAKDKLKIYGVGYTSKASKSIFSKLAYLRLIPDIKREIKKFKPDIVHSHYISSYGLLAFLSGFRPYVLSVWGSDIMSFPNRSVLHKKVIQLVLNNSSKVFASSKIMMDLLHNSFHIDKCVQIPFGVDTTVFSFSETHKSESSVTFIIIKSLLHIYGIDIAIKAFIDLIERNPHEELKLEIYGDGPQRKEYEVIASSYIKQQIFFYGKIAHQEVPKKLRQADVLINISRNESFGVSVIEASACGLAVIVSDRGGVPETVVAEKTGIVLRKLDKEHCLQAMERYISDKTLIRKHGTAGREFVEETYKQEKSVALQLKEYRKIISY